MQQIRESESVRVAHSLQRGFSMIEVSVVIVLLMIISRRVAKRIV
jgi:prepilin-type N-terminal cleavage/methylation domain-containing protein